MSSPQWCFADFRLDPDNACLWRGTQSVALTPKAFDVLHYLVTHPDRLVTKDTLLDAVWPETAISDAVVRIAIGELRRALGDTAQASRFIATVHRRGYRFVVPVVEHLEEVPEPASPVLPTMPSPAVLHRAPVAPPPAALLAPEAERRHLTVLFCDLIDSTTLAGHMDPEDLREVMHAYHQTCEVVTQQYDGYIAQYLGDGILVYFGYPVAHEDDAQRAVRAGLGILHALAPLHTRLPLPPGDQLAVRLGIHTGLVVVGEVGAGARQELLAIGETPNLAARLQGLAAPNTLVISAATWQLLGGFFACQALGPMHLHGRAQPLEVYQVLAESTARSRLEAASSTGLTPLVGREPEVALLRERWARVKDGLGQVVLLSGEAGIGKSRLVQVLQAHVATEPQTWLAPCQCSPYHQNTAWYPLIDLLERVVLRFARDESPPQKLRKLEGFLVQHGLPLAATVPLFAALLTLPLPADYAPLSGSPAQQKQQTLYALLTILLRIAAQQPVLFVMEDLHWVDPSTLEFLSLLVDQGPTARILTLLTFRPDFSPPWTGRSHLTQVMVPRLPRRQVAELTGRVAHGKALPPEVVEQIVAKTDGVPLFVEELTKMVLESDLLQEREEDYALSGPLPSLAIPTTLHDSLMARLDRLAGVKGLAQLGATLGREFSYELLHAVSPWDEATLQQGLHQLVAAEFLYQRGLPPHATYLFKHALIQEAAYQSVLKRTRQQYHQCIAQVLEAQFPEMVETQPELLAYHYTEAGLNEQALPYWQRAGAQNSSRSAYPEAISYLNKGLSVLQTLPASPERARREMELYTTLAPALRVAKGPASPETERAYIQARKLCHQVEAVSPLLTMLEGLCSCYVVRGEYRNALELGEESLALAQRTQTPARLLDAYRSLGTILRFMGEFASARTYLEAGIALYDPQQRPELVRLHGMDLGVICGAVNAFIIWLLGYADQARQCLDEVLVLARQHAHPYSLAFVLNQAIDLFQQWKDLEQAQRHLELVQHIATTHGFPFWTMRSNLQQGVGAVLQGHEERGISQLREGLAAQEKQRVGMGRTQWLVALAKAYGQAGQPKVGLEVLNDALTIAHTKAERYLEAEVHRLRGELLLQSPQAPERAAADCFQRALTLAQEQGAKVWELRATISLSRLWQQQGKNAEARDLLAPIYGWFTEGLDTADLQEAKALLDELAG